MRVLIDTCVIIDALQNREPFNVDAQKIFMAVANRQCSGFVSAKSVTDIYYITHRATHSDKETRKILNALLFLFDILDTTGMDCRRALTVEKVSDYEDAVMIETAAREDIDYIVTRNKRDYKDSSVPVMSPMELLRLLDEDRE